MSSRIQGFVRIISRWKASSSKKGEQLKKSRRQSPKSEVFLPGEIITEILTWLPVKSVLKCKSVCKLWYAIIEDQKFIEKHGLRSKSRIIYDEITISNRKNTEIFQLSDIINGLLLEVSADYDKVRIRNPSIKRVLELPHPATNFIDMRMFFVRSIASYKVVCIDGLTAKLSFKTLTVGIDRAWRRFNFPITFDINDDDIFFFRVDDHMACLIKLCYVELTKTEIFSVNLEDESMVRIKLPRGFASQSTSEHFMTFSWEFKISIGFIIGEDLNVWILENNREQIWSEKKIIHLNFLKEYPDVKLGTVCIRGGVGSQLHFDLNSNRWLAYDIQSKTIHDVITAPPNKKLLINLFPSLVFLPGMLPEKKITIYT